MSAYGASRETTPTVDRLRERSLLFSNAFSTSSWTIPAHASMLTGRYPSSLAPNPSDRRAFRAAPSLAQLFREAGYATAAFAGGGFLSKSFGVDRGFDVFEGGAGSAVLPHAVEWLEQERTAPFFLFFHTYHVHIYYTDRRYVTDEQGGRLSSLFTAYPDPAFRTACCDPDFEPTADEEEFTLALYDGGVAAADEMVAEIIGALERRGLMENTAIIFTSDHGEEFWEHTGKAAYHGHSLYDEILRIPFIWYEPGMQRAGQTVDAPVSLIDIVPTVAARFGLAAPADLDGVDLGALIAAGEQLAPRPLFAEGILHGPQRWSVRTAKGKLITTPKPDVQAGEGKKYPVPTAAPVEVYLPDDTDERRNMATEQPGIRAELLTALREHRAAAATEPPGSPGKPGDELPDETTQRLRALGYVD